MEAKSCIFCHHDRGQYVLEENGYKGKQCAECSLIYITPRPSRHEVIDLYGHSNAVISAQSHITPSIYKTLHARHTLKLIKRYKKSGDLLEIGSGGGHFLVEAHKAGFVPHGLELNPLQAAHIREQGIACEEKPLHTESFAGKKFDVIYHCDVISHFHEPIEEFKIMHEALKEGGLLIFETGNIGDIDRAYDRLFTQFQYPDHLFFFAEKNFKTLLMTTGFKLAAIHRYTITPSLRILKMLYKPARISAEPGIGKKTSWLKGLLKGCYHRGLYIIRYKLGAVLPKKRRPQTVIIIAQKRAY